MLIEAISKEEDLDVHGPSDDLLELQLITPELAFSLARSGINTKNKLAEQSVDDLQEIDGLDEDLAAKVILQAREDWFKAGEIITDDMNEEELETESETKVTEDAPVEELEVETKAETEVTDASVTAVLDLKTRNWSGEILDGLGVEERLFPKVVESPTVTGQITESVASETGLYAGIPVCAGGGDMACMAVGSGVRRPGIVSVGIGTAGHVLTYAEEVDGAALIFIAVLFVKNIVDIEWNDIAEAGPAVLAMIAMPLTYSISNGIAIAFCTYALIKICTGKVEGVSPAIWLVAVLSAINLYIYS